MQKIFLFLTLPFILLPALIQAQTTKEEFLKNVNHSGGVLQSYNFVKTQATPAPNGYKPFYISHYGRHGSRWLTSAENYHLPEKILGEAHQHNKLTALGESLYERVKIVVADAEKHYGDLSPRGVIEHKEIAGRMFHSFPEVFSTKDGRKCYIYSRSTLSPRCIISMAANNERLKELNPAIIINREATNRNSYLNADYKAANKDSISAIYHNFLKKHFNPRHFLTKLFNDSVYANEQVKNPAAFISDIFQMAGDLQDRDQLKISMFDVFSKEDIFTLWEAVNIDRYYNFTSKEAKNSAKGLLKNILDCADSAIKKGNISADLRFGHDSYISPLLALMDVNELYDKIPNPENICKVWSDFKVTPMGTNLQIIFYRNSKTGDIILKVLHCEKEAKIPVPTDIAPYYHWKDFKAYYTKIIEG